MSLEINNQKSESLKWDTRVLKDVVDVYIGKTPPRKEHKWFSETEGVKWVSIKDLGNCGIYVKDTSEYLTHNAVSKFNVRVAPKNTVLLSFKLTVGRVAITTENMVTNEAIAHFIIKNEKKLSRLYLYYYLKTFNYNTLGSTSSIAKAINSKMVREIPITLPPIEIQDKISKILFNIDSKIEVINDINNNLEKYLFYIFREYFMEFDFNEFSNSNDDIPSSWKLGCFNDIIDSIGSGDWGKEEKTGNYTSEVYCIRGADIPEVKQGNKGKMPIRFILPKNFEKRKLDENSIVIEISGGSPTQSTGRTVLITDNFLNRFDKDIICTNFCKVINPKNEYAIFLYLYLNYLYEKDVMFAYENGTTGIKNFDIKSFINNFKIIIPSLEYISKFNNIVYNVFNKIMHNGLEIEQLQKLRDTLLPKLMSGEIDVSKINCDLKLIIKKIILKFINHFIWRI